MEENMTMADLSAELEASYGRMYVWDRLEAMMESGESAEVEVVEVAKGGVVAFLEGVRGFIPASKLALEYVEESMLKKYLHQMIVVRIIDLDEEERRLVLSAREILKEVAEKERLQRVSDIKVGSILEGMVESLKPYGAFIDLGNDVNGLLHISQICKNRIKHPGVVLNEGQSVTVMITGNEDGKLSLSMRALEEASEADMEEEIVEIPETEEVTTSLGALLAGLKL